jgi:ankyrin repeat protein
MATWEQFKETMAEPITLWSAAKDNDLITLTRLLDEGGDIDARDGRGYSALMLAAYAGNLGAAELLIAHGADCNSRDHAGNSVLMGVAFKGHLPLLRLLLAAGADPTARNQHGLDARGFAVTFGRHEVVAVIDAYQNDKGEADNV